MVHLKIKAKNDEVYSMYKTHGTFHQGDSGLDLFVIENQIIKAGETGFVHLGFSAAAYDLTNQLQEKKTEPKGVSWLMMPRSSICRTPLRLANSVGLIDAGYRGEVMAVFDNIKGYEFQINKGDRLVQAVAFNGESITYELVDQLDVTSRGEGGFGSTDTKVLSPKLQKNHIPVVNDHNSENIDNNVRANLNDNAQENVKDSVKKIKLSNEDKCGMTCENATS